MRVLVLSETHFLAPFAYRLKREGHDVEMSIRRKRYRPAWGGRIDPPPFTLKDKPDKREASAVLELMNEHNVVVFSDTQEWNSHLVGRPNFFGIHRVETNPSPVYVGAWFTGEHFIGEHLLFVDWGLWPGGLGAMVPGGAVLIRPQGRSHLIHEAINHISDSVKSSGFKGLVQVGINVNLESQEWVVGEWQGGWLPLHTHAFLSRLESFGDVLQGQEPQIPEKFQVVVPVSIPPYPVLSNVSSPQVLVGGLEKHELKDVFFHCILVGDNEIKTAGTDGLVGVVRGYGHNLHLARSRAVRLATKIQLPEKQFRPDVGNLVDTQLALLEELGVVI